jgi:hypothetical protein
MSRVNFAKSGSRSIDVFDRRGDAGVIGAVVAVLAFGVLAAGLVAQEIGYARTLAGVANLLFTAAISVGFAMPAYLFAKSGRCPLPRPGSRLERRISQFRTRSGGDGISIPLSK